MSDLAREEAQLTGEEEVFDSAVQHLIMHIQHSVLPISTTVLCSFNKINVFQTQMLKPCNINIEYSQKES